MQDTPAMFSDGAAYERLMGRWSQKAGQQFLDWLAPAPGLHWLDVGCGNGAFTEVIARHDPAAHLTGIDPAEAQIAYAQSRPGTAGARFVRGDAQSLPFADAEFDHAVMALVIAFVPDPARCLSELVRVTRPGGTVSTYMWDLPSGGLPLTPLFRSLAAIGHPGQMPPSAAVATRPGLTRLWQEAGLADIASETITITVTFDDFEDFWISNTLPAGPQAATIRALAAADRDRLRDHLRQSLPTDARGRIAYPAIAQAVRGRRP